MSQAGIASVTKAVPTIPTQFTTDSGVAVPAANNLNDLGSGSITTSAVGDTVTTQLTGLTNHNVLVGAGTSTITKVAPSATSGVPLISQGAAADPAFGTAVVAGGGTGATTLTDHGVLLGQGTNAVTATAVGTNGQVLVGASAADPAFATLASSDSSITFTPGPNSLSLQVTGGSTVGKTITGNSGGAISPSSGNWNLVTANSTVRFVGSGSTITQDFNQSNFGLGSSFASLTSGTFNHGVGSGALTNITSGTSNTAMGYIAGNSIRGGSANTAFGFGAVQLEQAGNNNTGIGYQALQIPNGASNNTAVGYKAGINLTTGSQNTLVGASALAGSANTATNNIAIGFTAASNYASSESSNIIIGNTGTAGDLNTIRIGTQGSGAGQQNKAFVAGITGVSVSNKQLVTINSSTGQLGSDAVTARSTLTANSSGSPTWSAMTDGQVIIGSTAGSPTAATLTAGTGVSITNASNSITINATGTGLTWTEVTGTSQNAAVNNGYIANNAGLVTITLPATFAVGEIVHVVGKGTGLWKLAANTGDTIHFGNQDTSAGGSLTATHRYDAVQVIGITANTDWCVTGVAQGNLTVA